MTLLQTEQLTKQFGGLTAVDEVDMEIEQGEGVSLIGPNGAGKSTLINLVTRRLEPSYGDVSFKGESIVGMDPHEVVQQGMSKSFQTASVFPELSVKENATIAALAAEHGSFRVNFFRHRNSYPAVEELTNDVLRSVGLYGERETQADSLDYGNKRRLELGIALAAEPDMLLMDEPTAGMSPDETQSTVELIKRVKDELDLTFLLVEHDMEIVFDISDRIVVLNRGSVISTGTPEEVQNDPAVQEAYLGGVEE
ncbi:ABC transporter ATP-binding protein [Halorubrum yunnanense]|uniref:Probable branched-chain amino acid transport ATP-binding protein LivG n=1 Tax=Halorubrum yunnanense TaxID=1526162 RepID=A0ABD5YEN9_9EURY|nr:ABC transporter ATP-binding protein [Halorubrum yunnanense]